MLKIGDTVQWSGGFGTHNPRPAKIESMQLTNYPREKYGKNVDEVDEIYVHENRVVFGLDNGHWCYSDQITL